MVGLAAVTMVLAVFISVIAVESVSHHSTASAFNFNGAQYDAEAFWAYRNAVMNYVQQHPTFRGQVPLAELAVSLPVTLASQVGHTVITTPAAQGIVMVCFGDLAAGALTHLQRISDNDASLGLVVDGSHWRTVAAGPSVSHDLMPLPFPLPAGRVISVVQLGRI